MRDRATRALLEIAVAHDPHAPVDVQVFLDALHDPKNYVVENAVDAWGRLHCTEAIGPLLDVVRGYRDGMDFSGARAAIKALGAMGEDAVPALLSEVRSDFSAHPYALRALAATGAVPALPVMKDAMDDFWGANTCAMAAGSACSSHGTGGPVSTRNWLHRVCVHRFFVDRSALAARSVWTGAFSCHALQHRYAPPFHVRSHRGLCIHEVYTFLLETPPS